MDTSEHGRWVRHREFGWRGRIAYSLMETGEYVVLWEPPQYRSRMGPGNFVSFEPEELELLDEPWEPWWPEGDEVG